VVVLIPAQRVGGFGDQGSGVRAAVPRCAHSWVGYVGGVCCIRCGAVAVEPGQIARVLRGGDAAGGEN